jgi:hypothetical protein
VSASIRPALRIVAGTAFISIGEAASRVIATLPAAAAEPSLGSPDGAPETLDTLWRRRDGILEWVNAEGIDDRERDRRADRLTAIEERIARHPSETMADVLTKLRLYVDIRGEESFEEGLLDARVFLATLADVRRLAGERP